MKSVFLCGLVAAGTMQGPLMGQITAYGVAEGTVGMQGNFGGALGMDFTTSGTLQIVELGAFDSGGDGIMLPITVELWARRDGGTPLVPGDDTGDSVLAFASFGPGDDGTLAGGSRFKALGAPLELAAGAYTIVAYGYGALEPNFNAGPMDAPELSTTQFPTITFVGTSRFGDQLNNGQFPAVADGGPADRYGAGTFRFTVEDTDGDGMPDLWESAYGLNPNDPADADDDTDGDGLTSLQEYESETDPTNADSDADGLDDGEEIARGTDPYNPDSDGDGLLDGVETGTGIFVDASDTGTDPTNSDTDGDRFSDSREIDEGTNPNNSNDFPREFLAIDYRVPGIGTQEFGEGLGHDFIVNELIRVSSLGVFDSGADGLGRTLASELWRRDPLGSNTLLASLPFTPADPGELLNSNRLKLLPVPVDLEPGDYTIVGRGYGAGEPNGNVAGPLADLKVVNDGGGLIEFVGGSRWGGGPIGVNGFPTMIDSGPAVRYAAGTFVYETPAPEVLRLEVSASGDDLVFEWNSKFGKAYDLLSETTSDLASVPGLGNDPSAWSVVVADIAATAPLNTQTIPRPADSGRLYVVVEKDGPPVFEDDFETDKGWTAGVLDATGDTHWERGAPTNVGPPTGANGSATCFGTNLGSIYGFEADIWLRSPAIDLTGPGITGARLTFQQFKAIEDLFDVGSIRVLRASDDAPLGPDVDMAIDGFSVDWEEYTKALPSEAIGEVIRIEFQFTSDNFLDSNYAGWYIDEVEVHVR